MSDERTTIKLDYPVEFGKETIEELSLRPGRLGDLKGVQLGQKPSFDELIAIASRMSGKPIAVISKLHEDDAFKVVGPALLFFGKCLGTGGTE